MRFTPCTALICCLMCLYSLICLSNSQCHYSCLNCHNSYYTSCTECKNGEIEIVKDSTIIQKEYHPSQSSIGVCNAQIDYRINALGMILLSITIIGIPLTKSKKYFYLMYTLQSFGLISLTEFAWVNPLGYVLYALQCLMPFNIISKGIKQESILFKRVSYYRLNGYFTSPGIFSSLAVIGILDAIIILFIIILPLFEILQRKYFSGASRLIGKIIKILVFMFFLLIQETVLAIIVALYFEDIISREATAIAITYGVILLVYCLIISKKKVPFFTNKLIQYQTISKKIIYPVFIILPLANQYVLIVMMLCNNVLQIIFDYRNKTYPIKNTYTAYRALQLLIVFFIGIYQIVEHNVNQRQSSLVLSYIITVLLCLFMICLIIQIGFYVKKRIWKDPNSGQKKKKNIAHLAVLKTQNTLQTIEDQVKSQQVSENKPIALNKNINETIQVIEQIEMTDQKVQKNESEQQQMQAKSNQIIQQQQF